jgi:hypothetical protein
MRRKVPSMLGRISLAVTMLPALIHGQTCILSDLQSCASCPAPAKVLDNSRPDAGEYYRGAYWNGLFAAYRLNCVSLGEELLKHGANPNLGGASGSFPATLVQAWPHHDVGINRKWVDLVLKYRLDMKWRNPWTGRSAAEIIADHEVAIDYPDLLRELSANGSKPGGKK